MDACDADKDASCSLARFADLGERVLVWMDGSLHFAVIAVISVQYDTIRLEAHVSSFNPELDAGATRILY